MACSTAYDSVAHNSGGSLVKSSHHSKKNFAEEQRISKGDRWTLKWKSNLVPTIMTEEIKVVPISVLPTPSPLPRKLPTERSLEVEPMDLFLAQDVINDF